MKVQHEDRPVERSGDLVENEFTIKATRKAFAILSSGLYTNKPRAIIRELSCNAFDAHVEAGKGDLPIEVKLPTAIDPQFYVKDYGIGLDDDGVMSLYTTYFESTKTQTNEQIGYMGLGSKSPFSYTHSFQIESRHNGKKRFYTAFINEGGTPAITRLAEQDTTEPNGLTVILQVKREDIPKFEQEAKYALMYFNPKPNVVGRHSFHTYSIKHTIEGKTWKIRQSDDYTMSGPYVLQGFVPYPVDKTIMMQNGLSPQGQAILTLNIDMYVPIGDVEVQASREGLSYDPRTISNVVNALNTVADELHTTVQKEFDACPTLWAARMKYASFHRNDDDNKSLYSIFKELRSQKEFTWRGQPLNEKLSLDVKDLQFCDVVLYYKTKSNKSLQRNQTFTPNEREKFKNKQGDFAFECDLHKDLPIVIDDLYGSNDIIRQFLENRLMTGKGYAHEKYVLVIRPLSKRDESASKREIVKILALLGNPTALLASQLGFTTTRKSYYKKRAKNMMNVWVGFSQNGGWKKDQIRRVFSKVCYTTREIDLTDGGYYLPVERFAVMWKGAEVEYIDKILDCAVQLNIFKRDQLANLVAMNEDEQKMAQKEGKWTNVLALIEREFALLNSNHILSNTCVAAKLIEHMGRGVTSHVVAPWKKIRDKVNSGLFKAYIDQVLVYCVDKTDHSLIDSMINLLRLSDEREYITKSVDTLSKEWDDTKGQYKMLRLIDWHYLTLEGRDIVLDYINTVEEVKKNGKTA